MQDRWPTKPSSDEPFTSGDGVGHFAYAPGLDGTYTLSAPLAGTDVSYVIEGDVTPGVTSGGETTSSSSAVLVVFADWNPPGR